MRTATTLAFAIATLLSGPLLRAHAYGESEDHFADKLVIPDNVHAIEPSHELDTRRGLSQDVFQARLLAALEQPGGSNATVTPRVDSLLRLGAKSPAILKRYLSTSPAWRVFSDGGSTFATRRWMIGSSWSYQLHGYYGDHDLDLESTRRFQSRTTIGLSGKPWARQIRDMTRMQADEEKLVTLSLGNEMHQSLCVVSVGDLVLEVFEQSEARERRLTKAAMTYINEELKPLAASPDWQTIKSILPRDSIRRGQPSIDLRNSFQPGIYNSEIWVNPGEPGIVYLRAVEITTDKRLSERTLPDSSHEWIGWSDDAAELFFSNTHFTISEGDWGKPYAARFEVWFVPDSGRAERKLLERVFKIEGWQQ